MAQATLSDIAEKVGVSHATVSRIMNGKQNSSHDMRQRVFDVARELGYRPNHFARALVSKREGSFPVQIELLFCNILPEHENFPDGFQMQIVQGIYSAARGTQNVNCHLSYWHEESSEEELRCLERANGVILLGNSDYSMVEKLVSHNINVVLVDHDHEGLNLHSVLSDDISGGIMAVKYLVKRGFTRIGWLGGDKNCFAFRVRLDGVRMQLAKLGIPLRAEDVRFAERTTPDDFEATIEQWLDEGDMPEAIITPTSLSVQMVQHALGRRGMKMPRDLSLISFGNDVFSQMSRPVPTRIAVGPEKLGQAAMSCMLQMLSESKCGCEPCKIVFPVKLLEGDSVAYIK